MNRRDFLVYGFTVGAACRLPHLLAADEAGARTLYNGIRLTSPWPPRIAELTREPRLPPYLQAPPAVIPIDVGRQLLVDDFLVEKTDLRRTHHHPDPHPGNPVVKPDRPWEQQGRGPMAMVFSDGVWYDPKDRLFKMWYMGGYGRSTCYAFSEDGLRWTKPDLDVHSGTNVVHPEGRDSTAVWLDHEEKDPARRFKLFRSHGGKGGWALSIHFSPDGIHWSAPAVRSGPAGDRTTAFWNPFLRRWVLSLRGNGAIGRLRRYREATDLVAGARWAKEEDSPLWTGSDRLDPQRADLKTPPQLYNLDCVAYESILLGLFSVWRGDRNIPPGRPKPNEICVGYSRDGFHWDRPDRKAFVPVSEHEGDWNWGNVQSAGGCCLVVGDKLYFYHSGRAGQPGKGPKRDASGSTGLAVLRRDGFASLDADESGGTLTTRPVRFGGTHLFVNADAARGELAAEVLDEQGNPLPGFTRADCVPVSADRTRQKVAWKAGRDLKEVAGKPVKFRFHLKSGRLYAFWVSPDASGSSRGYVAAGGPGFQGPADGGASA